MDRNRIYSFFERRYVPKNSIISYLPLGMKVSEVWPGIQERRKAVGTEIPITSALGSPHWFVTTDKMLKDSEKIVAARMEFDINDRDRWETKHKEKAIAPLEEVFFTSYVEGSPMRLDEAMGFLTSGRDPQGIEEQMILNNRNAIKLAGSNLYQPMDEGFLKNFAYVLTINMDGGGYDYRTQDYVKIPFMRDTKYVLPSAADLPRMANELINFLSDNETHPLIKAAVVQAWVLTVQPFVEGNERLGRLLSQVILMQTGYSFFGDISFSLILAKDGYRYYNAIYDILCPDNEGDLTYFIEYYLELLSYGVDEWVKKKQDLSEPVFVNRDTPMERSISVEHTIGHADTNDHEYTLDGFVSSGPEGKIISINSDEESGEEIIEEVAEDPSPPPAVDIVEDYSNSLQPEENEQERKGDRQLEVLDVSYQLSMVGEKAGATYEKMSDNLNGLFYEEEYIFSDIELAQRTGLSRQESCTMLDPFLEENVVIELRFKGKGRIFMFANDMWKPRNGDYSAEYKTYIKTLSESHSKQEKRIAEIIQWTLTSGYILVDDYLQLYGNNNMYSRDMRKAERLGLVKKVSQECYLLPRRVISTWDQLTKGEIRVLRKVYEKNQDREFTAEECSKYLRISEPSIYQYFLMFKRLKICAVNTKGKHRYRLIVNPKDNPECFGLAG